MVHASERANTWRACGSTWLLRKTGLALSCDGLTINTVTPIPYAPFTVERGRGTDDMLMHATLCPTKTTRSRPRTPNCSPKS